MNCCAYERRWSTCALGWLALVLIGWIGPAGAEDSPQAWLERMVGSAGQVNFRGTLVHMCGGKVDVVSVTHRVENGRITERVRSLDADGREIIRNPEEVMCILPDRSTVMVGSRQEIPEHADQLLAPASSFTNVNPANYRLQMLGQEYVAGQATEIIAIRPLDGFRYGYRLWLDRERAMPLKYELISETGDVLEQTLFTEIQFSDQIRPAEVEPTIVMDSFVWQRDDEDMVQETTATGAPAIARTGWRVREMPAGFALTATEVRHAEDEDSGMQHLVYSDGVAAVSVFIERDVAEFEQQSGMSEVGAVNAYTTMVDGYLVTAVGDVPMPTVQMIALSVEPPATGER